MSKPKLERLIDQATSFARIAQLLKKAGYFNHRFLNQLYSNYHIRYNQDRQFFESDLDHPGIFYDCTYRDAKECVNSLLRQR